MEKTLFTLWTVLANRKSAVMLKAQNVEFQQGPLSRRSCSCFSVQSHHGLGWQSESTLTKVQVSYDTGYDDASRPLSGVACSDGKNGLITRYGFQTQGNIPNYPNIGGYVGVAGWNSSQVRIQSSAALIRTLPSVARVGSWPTKIGLCISWPLTTPVRASTLPKLP